MNRDSGVILVNVLVVLAIGAAITVLMFNSQDNLLNRTTRAAQATQAQALAIGAETSIVVALQHDMTTAPDTDHFGEEWASAAQLDVELATGRFSITIDDAQSRFNLNNLAVPSVLQPQILQRLTRSLDLPDAVANTIVRHITQRGPIADLNEIVGIDAAARDMLTAYVTALPVAGQVNLNTANAPVIGAVLGNAAAARQLVKTRDRTGFLTQSDLTDVGILSANGAGFTSQVFDVIATAEVDGVVVTLQSRLLRRTGVGISETVVISRRFGQ